MNTFRQPAFRHAAREDLPALVRMLADDPLGASRETTGEAEPSEYLAAFEAIEADPNHEILVADRTGEPIAMLQMTILPSLTYRGRPRGMIEGVRVRSDERGQGLGRAILDEAIRRLQVRGCHLVQLTTDKRRPAAIRFYERAGFTASHEGMKLFVASPE